MRRLPIPDGRVWAVHVDPPSVVPTIAELPNSAEPVYPPASHTETDGHTIGKRPLIPAGTGSTVQVAPPLIVPMMAAPLDPEPTASQTDAEGQAIAAG